MKMPFMNIENIKKEFFLNQFLQKKKYDLLYMYIDQKFLEEIKIKKVANLIEKLYDKNSYMKIMFFFRVNGPLVKDFIEGYPLEKGVKIDVLSF